jgi:hypothetical protein
VTELDSTIRLINSAQPMSVAALERAAAALSRCAAGDVTALAARVRVAFRLEKLGA